MSEIEKYIGEALMKEEPKKKLSLKIKDDTIGTSQLKDKAVTKDKVDDEAIGWDNLDHNVQNIIETSGSGGTGLATDWGDSEKLGITQKKLTEEHEAVDARIGALEDDLDENYYTKNSVYNKSETYTKEEVNNIASAYTSQKYASVEAAAATTASDIADLIAEQAPTLKEATDTIYRVASFDGTEYDTTKYAEYTYNGTSYILMDVKSPGIDEEPTAGSDNLVESGGVFSKVMEIERLSSKEKGLLTPLIKSDIDVLTSSTNGRIDMDGSVKTSSTYFISQPISLSLGDTIAVSIISNESTVIAEYVNSHYKPIVTTVDTQGKQVYCYTADRDITIAVCGHRTSFGYCRKVLLEGYEKLGASDSEFINIDYSTLSDGAILPDGSVETSSTYYITEPIELSAGDIIECECRYSGGSNGIAALSQFDSSYIPLVVVHSGTEYGFAYLCAEDMEVVVSGAKDTPLRYRIISGGKQVTSFSDNMGKRIYGAFTKKKTDNIEVDINSDYGDGYLINTSSEREAYSGYFITSPIAVDKGDVVYIDNLRCSGETILAYIYDNGEEVSFEKAAVGSTNITHYEIEIKKRGNVVVSGSKDTRINSTVSVARDVFEEVATKSDIDDINSQINDLTTFFAETPIDLDINSDYGDGYYINKSSERVEYQAYFITSPVEVFKGDKIRIKDLRCSGETILAYYSKDGLDDMFESILFGSTSVLLYEAEINKDGYIVISGSKDTRSAASAVLARKAQSKVATMADIENLQYQIDHIHGGQAIITNPYAGTDMSRIVLSNTHEHCYDETKLGRAYARGLRVIACSHYTPASPRYPFSNFSYDYKQYTSMEDLTLVDKTCSGSISTITVDGQTIDTDTIPQIANAEHPFIGGIREHFNILGLLWAEPGHSLVETGTPSKQWKMDHAIVNPNTFNALLEDETKWQFGSQYVFGTINHTYSIGFLKDALDACPQIFKAMEIFNQGYSKGWNQQFKDSYDALLRDGYRLWCTAVVDWQNDWATWDYSTSGEKDEWTEKFNELPAEEQEEYGTPENYYMETGRFKFDRGANAVIVPANYDNMTPFNKAKEIVKSYINGRYYLVGLGNYSVNIAREGNDITFIFNDVCPNIKVINGMGDETYSNVDTVVFHAKGTEKYVRVEAEWDDGDFVYTNPIWIE